MNHRYPDLDLDMTFRPIHCDRPQAFEAGQIEAFNRDGYIANVPLLDEDELSQVRERVQSDGAALRPLHPHVRIDWVRDLLRGERLTAYLRDLLGPNVVCHVSQYLNKPPGHAGYTSAHQDAAFNAMDARSVIVWIALADADEANGCMHFMPGSHLLGGLTIVSERDCNLRREAAADAEARCGSVPIEMRAGCAAFFSDLLVHTSPPNRTTDRDRPALTLTCAPAEVCPHPPARGNAVLCCGHDAAGHWVNSG